MISLIFIDFHWFSLILIDFYLFSLIFHWFSLIRIDFHLFSLFYTYFHIFSMIFIDFMQKLWSAQKNPQNRERSQKPMILYDPVWSGVILQKSDVAILSRSCRDPVAILRAAKWGVAILSRSCRDPVAILGCLGGASVPPRVIVLDRQFL